MSSKKVVILDGCGLADGDLAPVLGGLSDLLKRDGSQIETFPLHAMKLAQHLERAGKLPFRAPWRPRLGDCLRTRIPFVPFI